MESSKCPKCGDEPQFVEHMSKWYCYGCNTYIDDEPHRCEAIREEQTVDEEKAVCKNCGAELQGLKDGKLFCFVCETYPDEPEEETEKVDNEAQTLVDDAMNTDAVKAESPPAVEPKSELTPSPAPSPEPSPTAQPSEPAASPEPSPAPAPAVAPPQEEAPKKAMPQDHVKTCPSCGKAMKWIDKYQRHYCYGCRKYSPKDEQKFKGPVEKRKCPGCSGDLRYIQKYNEWYCYSCKTYPLRKKAVKPESVSESTPSCPKCNKPLKWIEKYQRHYCFSCKAYAPKAPSGEARAESKKCPTCSGDMKYVAEYDEWYCYSCKKYSLRPSKPLLL